MRGIYISPGFGMVGAVMGVVIALTPVVLPWMSYGGFEGLELVQFVSTRWLLILGVSGAVVGGVLGALAGRSIVEAAFGLFKRLADWFS